MRTIIHSGGSPKPPLFGWIPPFQRSSKQHEAHERAIAGMQRFSVSGASYHNEPGRYALWEFAKKVNGGQHLPYTNQVTGSCVGAGWDNCMDTLQCAEIANGEPEEFLQLWWLYTYGQSRLRLGERRPGSGSTGATMAEAATKDGVFGWHEKPGLPAFQKTRGGWLRLTEAIELAWSDGDGPEAESCRQLAKKRLVGATAVINNADEWEASIRAFAPVTLASMFGTRGPRLKGTPGVMIAEWDDQWPHQMWSDECWHHPTEGRIFRIGNNWDFDAHPAPTTGEPPGGFYITDRTADRICRGREVIAYSRWPGFVIRDAGWGW